MANSVDLIVNIVTKMSNAGMKAAEKSTSGFKSGLNKASVVAGGALAGIVAFGAGAAAAASDVQQSLGAVDAVFGKNADTVKKWADSSSTAVGLSKNAYMELATVTGAQLKNMGLPMDKVTGKTNDLIKKGADLAATFGGTTADAVGAIGAALRGETDPIERYGVSIKQADIAAQQAAEGTSKLTGAAGKQAKTMALLHLMNKQTADSTGAFGRETDTAAHAAQVSAAQTEDMKAALGTALLPIITKVTAALGALAGFMTKHATITQIAVGVVAALAAGILALNVVITISTALTALLGEEMAATWLAALGPIGLVILAVVAVVAIITILWKKSETFRTIVLAVWGAIKAGAAAMGQALVAVWQRISGAAQAMAGAVRAVWNGIRSAASAVANFVRGVWQAVWGAIGAYVRAYLAVFRAVFNTIRSVAAAAVGFVRDKFSATWRAIEGIVGGLLGKVSSVMSGIRDVASNAFNAVRSAAQSAVNTAVNTFQSLPGKVKAAFSGAASLLLGVGADIIHGLVAGIGGAAHLVESAVSSIINKIPKAARKLMGIASPSKVMRKIGHDIMRGLNQGMADGVAGAKAVTQTAVDAITSTIKAASKTAGEARRLTTAAVKTIGDESAALVRNAKKRATVYAGIATQTELLKAQKDAWDQLKGSVADTAQQFGSFAGTVGDTLVELLADMTDKVAKVQLFQSVLNQLTSLGLNKTTVSELASAGPAEALARAQMLLAGGQAAVQQVNALQAQLTTAADTLGTQTAVTMYQAGIDATQALLDGLLADKARLEAAAERLAQNLADAVRRALAKYTPHHPKKGAGKSASAAYYAAPTLNTAMSRGVTPVGGTTVINVTGAVDPDSTARQIQRILAGHDRRVGMRVA